MPMHKDAPCDITLDHVPLAAVIASTQRLCPAAEKLAVKLLARLGPMPAWSLTRLVMERGYSAAIAHQSVLALILDGDVLRDNATRECSLAAHMRPRGLLARIRAYFHGAGQN